KIEIPEEKAENLDNILSQIPDEVREEYAPAHDAFTPAPEPPKDKGHEQYVPAHIPKELIDPRANSSKYEVHLESSIQTERDAAPIHDVHIDELLRMAVERKASDIHL